MLINNNKHNKYLINFTAFYCCCIPSKFAVAIISPFPLPDHSFFPLGVHSSFLHRRNWSRKVKIIFQAITHGYVYLFSFLFAFGELTNNRFVLQGEIHIPSRCLPLPHAHKWAGVCRCTMDACWQESHTYTQNSGGRGLACGKVMLHHGIRRTGPLLYQSPIVYSAHTTVRYARRAHG